MGQSYQVVRAFDRLAIKDVAADTAATLEAKIETAFRLFRNRDQALKPHQRSAILGRASSLLAERIDTFAQLIAAEGGKPLTDARIEAVRAVDGLRNAADEIRNFAGREIPMGLTPASEGRWAFTTREPIGVVAAISAFNHPLNLIVHQVAPAIAVGCPVIIKPAAPTPLSCLEFVALLREAGLPEPWCQTLITEDNALSERLVVDPRIAFLSFIGSARVGWYLRSKLPPGTRCASNMGVLPPSSSIAAPSWMRSSSRSSKAAITMPDRSACRSSASSCIGDPGRVRRALGRAGGKAPHRRPAAGRDRGRAADPAARDESRPKLDR